jgi:hypothetical protein
MLFGASPDRAIQAQLKGDSKYIFAVLSLGAWRMGTIDLSFDFDVRIRTAILTWILLVAALLDKPGVTV